MNQRERAERIAEAEENMERVKRTYRAHQDVMRLLNDAEWLVIQVNDLEALVDEAGEVARA